MVKALKTKVGNPLRKLVLIKLADNASDTGECWPSYRHIADQCEISRRSVMNHVKQLEQEGFLKREYRKGEKGNSSNIFHLSITKAEQQKAGEYTAPPSEPAAPSSESAALPPSESAAPRTSHSIEPVNEPLNNKPKKSRKEVFDFSSWPAMPTEQTLNDWIAMRKDKKAKLNQTAINRLAKHLHDAVNAGFSVEDCIATCATRGWVGFEAKWLINAGVSPTNAADEYSDWAGNVFDERDPLI